MAYFTQQNAVAPTQLIAQQQAQFTPQHTLTLTPAQLLQQQANMRIPLHQRYRDDIPYDDRPESSASVRSLHHDQMPPPASRPGTASGPRMIPAMRPPTRTGSALASPKQSPLPATPFIDPPRQPSQPPQQSPARQPIRKQAEPAQKLPPHIAALNPAVTKISYIPHPAPKPDASDADRDKDDPPEDEPKLTPSETAVLKDLMARDKAYDVVYRAKQARMLQEMRTAGPSGRLPWWDRDYPANLPLNRRPERFDVRYPRPLRTDMANRKKGARREGVRMSVSSSQRHLHR